MTDDRTERSRRVITQFGERYAAGDPTVWDDLVAADFVNHAAGPQGRDGWRVTFENLRHDLGDYSTEIHHTLADGDYVAVHLTLRGRHAASTMPLLTGVPVNGAEFAWTFMHLFRIEDGRVAEHWACRDDLGLLQQLGAWRPGSGAPAQSRPVVPSSSSPAK
jgi:predicted ester cyclase